MANEAVIIELGVDGGHVVRRTVADGTNISKGTICKLSDPNTAAASTTSVDVFAGIASSDKVASDGSTTLGLYTSGVFDLKVGDAVTTGRALSLSGSNILRGAIASDFISGCHIGYAEEDSSINEVIRVRLRGQ